MTILKNGKILKETYYFECPSCDCHWTANYNEVERRSFSVSNMSTTSIYVMRCPQCLRKGVEAKYNNYDPAKTNATENGALYGTSANVDPYVKACMEAEEAATHNIEV